MIRLFSVRRFAAIAVAGAALAASAACSGSPAVNPQGSSQTSSALTVHPPYVSQNGHKMRPANAYNGVLSFAQGISFPNANFYGNDTNPVGITFENYTGTLPGNTPYQDVLNYARRISFPNAQFYGNDGHGHPIDLVFN